MPYAPDLAGCALDGRYELHELIGEGGFGRVYRGLDRRLARTVAIKVIKPWWADDPEWARRFERETQLLAQVSDPGIVQIFDVGHADEGLYYVAELVEGESLSARLRRGPVAQWEACEIAEQLCRALAHAHGRGIVHRDIKPANILLSSHRRVKVGDFGVARSTDGTSDGPPTIVGTPRYTAPEQACGDKTSPSTDVYSAGIVLYEMLAGETPFQGTSAIELALAHLHDTPPPLPPGTPRALQKIVQRALAKDPEARYQSGKEMADALGHARGRSRRRGVVAAGEADTPGTLRIRKTAAAQPTRTLIAPKRSPRHTANPSARRRSIATIGVALAVLAALIIGAIALRAPARTPVPRLTGKTKAAAAATARRAHLQTTFSQRYDSAAAGTAIAQSPGPGTKIGEGSTVAVVLSAGPRPVEVPQLVQTDVASAQTVLGGIGLNANVTDVPAPGVTPGTVIKQSPAATTYVSPHRIVALSVAETPQWRPLTSFSGTDAGNSVPFRIRGSRWRIVYSMHYVGICTFIFFCSGPNAQIVRTSDGSTDAGFGLGDGSGQTRTFQSGPGVYEIQITPGSDTASWSIEVEDYF